jgi:hypothetical protein
MPAFNSARMSGLVHSTSIRRSREELCRTFSSSSCQRPLSAAACREMDVGIQEEVALALPHEEKPRPGPITKKYVPQARRASAGTDSVPALALRACLLPPARWLLQRVAFRFAGAYK